LTGFLVWFKLPLLVYTIGPGPGPMGGRCGASLRRVA
jgi:hypothetical protein